MRKKMMMMLTSTPTDRSVHPTTSFLPPSASVALSFNLPCHSRRRWWNNEMIPKKRKPLCSNNDDDDNNSEAAITVQATFFSMSTNNLSY